MPGAEAAGKPWRPSLRAEDLARFADNARDLEMEFLDRAGEPMAPDDWIEAKTDPDYLLVVLDRIENIEVTTTWIGIHIRAEPNWDRVIFGTQIVYLHPEDIERLNGPPPELKELVPEPEKPFSVFRLIEPVFGQLVGRYARRTLSDAVMGHRWVVQDFAARFRAEQGEA